MSNVYIALGSNVGDRPQNIARAIQHIKEQNWPVLKQSSVIETEPVGGPPQGKFLNAVIQIQTELSPLSLLLQLKIIEKNSFECDVWGMYGLIAQKFHNDGFLIGTEIPMNELDLFLDKHRNHFELICNEFLKAIKKYRKINPIT